MSPFVLLLNIKGEETMIKHLSGDVYKSEDVDIIFNPVGVRDNDKGFTKRVKLLYPKVYETYNEKVWEYSINELIGDIQLVYIGNNKFIMNAFCKNCDGSINKIAFTKTLVELCNLAYEYKLSIGIENAIGIYDKDERYILNTIINEVFKDVDDIIVKIYDKSKK